MVAMATKQNFEHFRAWSQLKAQQSLFLNSTVNATSWNYIFLEHDAWLWGGDLVRRTVCEEKQITKSLLL